MEKASPGPPSGHNARQLTQEERQKLEGDSTLISDFKRNKLEQEAKKNWDLFYKRNATHFFKDRHWIMREFPELIEAPPELEKHGGNQSTRRVLLEAGCGVGNTVFPLIEETKELFIYACDFSPRAIDLLKAHSSYSEDCCHGFVCDLTVESLCSCVPEGVDLASLFFVLSAITPEKMLHVLKNVFGASVCGNLYANCYQPKLIKYKTPVYFCMKKWHNLAIKECCKEKWASVYK